MSTRPVVRILAVSCSLAVLLLSDAPARAEVGGRVDIDLDLGSQMLGGSLAAGVGGRFGWRFDLGPIWLQPEAGGGYVAFPGQPSVAVLESGFYYSRHAVRVLGGLRFGGAGLISGAIEPALFAHAGYGWVTAMPSEPQAPRKGPAFDVGFALDVKVVRYFRFGVQASYNAVTSSAQTGPDVVTGASVAIAVKWVSGGAHVGVAF